MKKIQFTTNTAKLSTYYEIDVVWNAKQKVEFVGQLAQMRRLQNIIPEPLNAIPYKKLLARRGQYEEETGESLKPFYGSFQLRAWQSDEVYQMFTTIYKVPLKMYKYTSHLTMQDGRTIPLSADIVKDLQSVDSVYLMVALTPDGELKTYVISMQATEESNMRDPFIRARASIVKETSNLVPLMPEYVKTEIPLLIQELLGIIDQEEK